MILVPQIPQRVQYLFAFSYKMIAQMTQKTKAKRYVGGRPGYAKAVLFQWLLIKKVTNWDYRTIAGMAGISHPTLIRANSYFLHAGVYKKVLRRLTKLAQKEGLVKGEKVAMDSSFVHTFSQHGELGSEGWNGHKEGYGFKLHLLIDTQTSMPLSLSITNGLAHDSTLAVPLLEKAKQYLKDVKYVLGDKGYGSEAIVSYITHELHAKAGIPLVRRSRGKNYSWESSWRHFQLKMKGRTLKHSILNKRGSIERVFGQLKRTYHLGREETRGILNFAKNCYLSLICYSLKKFWIANITF